MSESLMTAVTAARQRSQHIVWSMHRLVTWWPLAILAVWLFMLVFPSVIGRFNPLALDTYHAFQAPSSQHWFGTDEYGRDVFSRCIYGLRYSLGASLVISFGGAILGIVVGGLAGMGSKWIDALVMRTTDVFLAFPYLIMAIAIAAAAGPSLKTVTVALLLLWWPSYARMVRGQVLGLRRALFVDGAKSVLTPPWKIFIRHIFPHLVPALSARISLEVGNVVVALAGLSFLGLGAQPPTPELGAIISDGREYIDTAWWICTLPGIFLLAVVLSSLILSDWIEERIS
jgi:peptide/nickel transport system permease protein